MGDRIQKRRNTALNWQLLNPSPILADGEEGYETDTRRSKVGNGINTWIELPYQYVETLPVPTAADKGKTPVVRADGSVVWTFGESIVDVTYSELSTMLGTLKVGQKYRITDFRTYHRLFQSTVEPYRYHTGNSEPLIVTANSSTELDLIAISELYPQDIIHYQLVDSSARFLNTSTFAAWESDRGRIIYRKDTVHNVVADFDFRNVAFLICKNDSSSTYHDVFAAHDPNDPTRYLEELERTIFIPSEYARGCYGEITIQSNNIEQPPTIAFFYIAPSEPDYNIPHHTCALEFPKGSEGIIFHGPVRDLTGIPCNAIYVEQECLGTFLGGGSVTIKGSSNENHFGRSLLTINGNVSNSFFGIGCTSTFTGDVNACTIGNGVGVTIIGNTQGCHFSDNVTGSHTGSLTNCFVSPGYIFNNTTGDYTGHVFGFLAQTDELPSSAGSLVVGQKLSTSNEVVSWVGGDYHLDPATTGIDIGMKITDDGLGTLSYTLVKGFTSLLDTNIDPLVTYAPIDWAGQGTWVWTGPLLTDFTFTPSETRPWSTEYRSAMQEGTVLKYYPSSVEYQSAIDFLREDVWCYVEAECRDQNLVGGDATNSVLKHKWFSNFQITYGLEHKIPYPIGSNGESRVVVATSEIAGGYCGIELTVDPVITESFPLDHVVQVDASMHGRTAIVFNPTLNILRNCALQDKRGFIYAGANEHWDFEFYFTLTGSVRTDPFWVPMGSNAILIQSDGRDGWANSPDINSNGYYCRYTHSEAEYLSHPPAIDPINDEYKINQVVSGVASWAIPDMTKMAEAYNRIGKQIQPPYTIVREPYGTEQKVSQHYYLADYDDFTQTDIDYVATPITLEVNYGMDIKIRSWNNPACNYIMFFAQQPTVLNRIVKPVTDYVTEYGFCHNTALDTWFYRFHMAEIIEFVMDDNDHITIIDWKALGSVSGKNIDGGSPSSVYLPTQLINGGTP